MPEMLFEVEPTEIRDNGAAYARRLSAVLGNGAEWDYHGECEELKHATGKCACGHHGLKYLFRIHHPDGRSVQVGSSCILSYPGVSPELAARLQGELDRLEAARRERERMAKEAAKSAEVQSLMVQWSEAEYRTDAAVADWHSRHSYRSWLPRPIYKRPMAAHRLNDRVAGKLHPYCRLPALKTASGQAKRLKLYLAQCQQELAEVLAER